MNKMINFLSMPSREHLSKYHIFHPSIESKDSAEEKHFIDQTTKLYDFVLKADNMLDKMTEFNENWLGKLVLKIMK